MAYYVPQFGSCFGASCADIFPGDIGAGGGPGTPGPGYAPPSLPGLFPFPALPGMPGVNVDVSVEGGGSAMIPYEEPSSGLPWWLWLAIGVLVARAMD